MKLSTRSDRPVKRNFCLTEACVVERDPLTYKPVTCKPLCDVSFVRSSMFAVTRARLSFQIFSIVRSSENPQELSIEYVKGEIRRYTSTDRCVVVIVIVVVVVVVVLKVVVEKSV